MNRSSVCSLTLLLALSGACDSTQTSSTTLDMTASPGDLGTTSVRDMTTSPKSDMTVVPPKLVVTNCTAATVTAATIYSTIIMNNCAGTGCHRGVNGNQPPVMGNSGTDLIAALVGQPSSNTMNYITANDVDNSYLLYKVFGQQQKVPSGGGSQMPLGVDPLSTADMCTLVNWVRSGAK